MEWVETTAKTLDEAREAALDQLGVGLDDAEFDILEEPRPGLFGRMRGEARLRARVRPTQARPKQERRRKPKADKARHGHGFLEAIEADRRDVSRRVVSRRVGRRISRGSTVERAHDDPHQGGRGATRTIQQAARTGRADERRRPHHDGDTGRGGRRRGRLHGRPDRGVRPPGDLGDHGRRHRTRTQRRR